MNLSLKKLTIYSINYLYLIALCMLMSSCGKNSGDQEIIFRADSTDVQQSVNFVSLTDAQYKMANIALGKVENRNLSNTIQVNGVLDVPPQNLVSISAPMGGFIRKTDLLQGMHIQRGKLLAVIENQDFIQIQQDYLDSQSKLEYMQQEFKRQQELSQENISAAKTFQQITAEYKSLQARVNALQERLSVVGIPLKNLQKGKITSTIHIYAPISGYVADVNVNIGKFVSPTDVLFTIVDTEHLHVELTVFEKDISKIRTGQKVRYTLVNEPEKERTAKVYLIGRQISAERSVRIHAHKDSEEPQMLPGMFVKAIIETDNQTVEALPQEAVVQSEGKHYIFLHKTTHKQGEDTIHNFEKVEIQKGIAENGYVEINFPQQADKTEVVVKGGFTLLAHIQNASGSEEKHGH